MSFGGETSGSVVKCRLFSQANADVLRGSSRVSARLPHEWGGLRDEQKNVCGGGYNQKKMAVNIKDCYGNQVINSKDSLEFSTENASTYQSTWYVLGSCVVIFSISCDFNHYRAQTTTRTEMTGEEWTRCLLLGNYAGS